MLKYAFDNYDKFLLKSSSGCTQGSYDKKRKKLCSFAFICVKFNYYIFIFLQSVPYTLTCCREKKRDAFIGPIHTPKAQSFKTLEKMQFFSMELVHICTTSHLKPNAWDWDTPFESQTDLPQFCLRSKQRGVNDKNRRTHIWNAIYLNGT